MPMPTLTEDGPLSLEGRGYPPVPKLPGFHSNQENARPRPQNLRFVNGIPGNYGDVRTRPQSAPVARGRGAKAPQAAAPAPVAGSRPGTAATSRVPAWLAFDRQVLRYYAFFKEAVTESPSEEWHLRKCTIMYYLEDGTLQVSEPKVDNSGIPQGTFLRRHRVAKPDGGFMTFQDLVIGTTISMYSRSFSIAGCDGFTREFLEAQGENPAANLAFPEDPYVAKKAQREAATQQRRGMTETSQTFFSVGMKNQSFFRNDRKVLRFFATWDDTGSLFGDRRAFIVHYYRSDDTVEILEVAQRNSGRDAFPLLLHRMRLPKHLYEVGVRPMSASARAKARHQYYHFMDLRIGSTVRVYGRDLLLHDCDEFTQNWYLSNIRGLSVADFAALPVPTAKASRAEPQVPPRDAFTIGSDEDTIANCVSLVPKQPLRDMHHFIANEGKVMRVTARIADLPPAYRLHSPADAERNFVLLPRGRQPADFRAPPAQLWGDRREVPRALRRVQARGRPPQVQRRRLRCRSYYRCQRPGLPHGRGGRVHAAPHGGAPRDLPAGQREGCPAEAARAVRLGREGRRAPGAAHPLRRGGPRRRGRRAGAPDPDGCGRDQVSQHAGGCDPGAGSGG